jgi:hypothetical protein
LTSQIKKIFIATGGFMNFFSSLFKLFILIAATQIYPQVPNGDFETWAGGEPTGWSTNNLGVTTITQSSDAHSGSSAVRGDNIIVNTTILQPLLISGLIGGHGFPISERYASLTGYYKLNAVDADNLSVVVSLFKNSQAMGVGGSQFFGASDYTLFTVPIFYSNGETPDSCQVSIAIGNNTGPVNLGSYFLVDDLAFSGISTDVGEGDNNPYEYSLEQNYPNPFNPSTTISYSVPTKGFILLKVYDALGKEITTLVEEEKSEGTYQVTFNAYSLTSGIYFYRLIASNSSENSSNDFSKTKKMMLVK